MADSCNKEFFDRREACPVCGGGEGRPFYSAPMTAEPVSGFIASQYDAQGDIDWIRLEGTDYTLMSCPTCDLVYQLNAPNDRLLGHIYSEMIQPAYLEKLERERLTLDNFDRIAGELSVLFRATGKHPSDVRFLDYGFGYGRWARVARALGASVLATEICEEKKAAARAIGVEVIPDEQVDDMRFDIVHTEQVFEHLVEPGREFRRLAAVTDGIIKVSVPRGGPIERLLSSRGLPRVSPFERAQSGKVWTRADFASAAVQPLEHLNAYSLRTMRWLAAANGLKIVGRVRKSATFFDPTSMKRMAASLPGLGISLGKTLLRPTGGYYVFARAN